MKTTITEALAEIELIKKKIKKKEDFIATNSTFATHVPDPFKSEGGQTKVVTQELQAVSDLYKRWVKIRSAIAAANLEETITLGEDKRSISEWLVWRREVAEKQRDFLGRAARNTLDFLKSKSNTPDAYKNDEGKTVLVSWESAIHVDDLLKKEETIETILGELDGKLSLKNATITIEI